MKNSIETGKEQNAVSHAELKQAKNLSGQAISLQESDPNAILRTGIINPQSISHTDVIQLQRSVGNQAVIQFYKRIGLINNKTPGNGIEGDIRKPENKETLPAPVQMKKDYTGLPDKLKSGVEKLSGLSMDSVKVNYNSPKPAEVGALGYTEGSNIYLAAGQEKHLAHEAWHVVQQALGRVKATLLRKRINNDAVLEAEAKTMGEKAEGIGLDGANSQEPLSEIHNSSPVIQRVIGPGKNGYVERYGSDEVLYAQWNEAAQSYDLFNTDGEGQRTGESIAKAAPDDEEYDFIGESYPLEATDTEGSDTEDEKGYQASAERREIAEKLIAREKGRLNVGSTAKRLEALDKAETPEAKNKAMFQKATRPAKKRLYRKEAKFLESQVKVGELSRLPSDPTEKDKAALTGLNQSLAEGTPIGEAEQEIDTEFQVAQYRGLFYTKSGFPSKELRRQHRKLDERQRPVFSTAALDTGARGREGYYALYNDPGKKEELQGYQAHLETKGDKIVEEIHGLQGKPAVPEAVKAVPGGTERLKPNSLADLNSHFYSQDYKGYMAGMQSYLDRKEGGKEEALDPIFGKLKSAIDQHADKPLSKASNPKVSTGATPVHASKYAFGLKPYKGSEGDVLDPKYDRSGKPRHPYGGKFYTSVHPLSDFDEHGPTPIVPLQNQHRVNLSQMIVPEHESQYDWMMKKDRVQMQYMAKYPNFSKPYKAVYAEKYGLTQELFEKFKTDLLKAKPGDERVFVESLLSKHLSQHLDLRAVDDAERFVKGTEEEGEKEAKLAYRTGEKSFGFEPPDIERAPIARRRQAKTEHEEDEGAAHTPPHKKHRVDRSHEPEPPQPDTAPPQPVKQKHYRKRRSSEKSDNPEPSHFAAEHEQGEDESVATKSPRKKHKGEAPHITKPPQNKKSRRQSSHSAKKPRRRPAPKTVAPAKL